MALADVFDAITSRWDAQSLDDTVSGGLILSRGVDGDRAPYVAMSEVAPAAITGRASRGEGTGTDYQTSQVQLLYVGRGGTTLARTHIAAIRAAFDWAPLSLDNGALIYCKFVSESFLGDPEEPGFPNLVLWALTYEIETTESTTLAPS